MKRREREKKKENDDRVKSHPSSIYKYILFLSILIQKTYFENKSS
jgi:hypothetical protein